MVRADTKVNHTIDEMIRIHLRLAVEIAEIDLELCRIKYGERK
jgi:hypothetical protein